MKRSAGSMLKGATRWLLLAAIALPGSIAQAQVVAVTQAPAVYIPEARPVRFFLGGGLTTGGDRLVTARYFDGSDYSLRGGGLFQIHGGLEFRVAPAFSLALSVGYHVDSVDTFYGSTWFHRVPIEALGHFRVHPNWRIGGGVRFAVDPSLSSDGFSPVADEEFDSSVGPVIEVEYLFNPSIGVKLRGVAERYKSKSGLPTVSGNHIGLMFNYYF